ncbi:DUF1254 domain-containing protein [Verrucomicrobium sp. BvORR106]|uniref:DUF1254 domain-containing protein n=1 Tax=Verrucomicrobium sp. BvORR106 TaxID=1403819 RepID=UPI0009DCF34E|nr:DUF1254 domain-containing protein [Verrucomicrobium sp. BvORR106]
MKPCLFLAVVLFHSALVAQPSEKEKPLTVSVDNFGRAESDLYFASMVKLGGFAKFNHNRAVTPITEQNIVRMNRDTLYSAAVFDLDAGPVTVTLPEPSGRFISMQVFDQDQYTHGVIYSPGEYTFTREKIGTRYVALALRILVDPANPSDLKAVHALQDRVKAQQEKPGTFEVPAWDAASQKKVRDALCVLADTLPDKNKMFGTKAEVEPVRRLLGVASGWGGNPEQDATYLNIVPSQNDGVTPYVLKIKDVPVDGFWSISVYNGEGFFEANKEDAYTVNNLTAVKATDGTITVQFGGTKAPGANYLPIVKGWNYMVRLYRPRPEILNGTWSFPEAQAAR